MSPRTWRGIGGNTLPPTPYRPRGVITAEQVETAARGAQRENEPAGWDGLNSDQRDARRQETLPGYRALVRAALRAAFPDAQIEGE